MEASLIDASLSLCSSRFNRSSTWDTRQGITAQAANADAMERIAASELMFKSILRYLWRFRILIEHYPSVILFPEDIANVFTNGINLGLAGFGNGEVTGFVNENFELSFTSETWINLNERIFVAMPSLPPRTFLAKLPIYDFRIWFLLRHFVRIV